MAELIDDLSVTEEHSTLIDLPDDSYVYSQGVLALVFLSLGIFFGLVFAKRSMDGARSALAAYEQAPEKYAQSSLRAVKKGKLLTTIGMGLFALEIGILICIVYFADWE